jgi:hypothetical protein
MAVVLVTDVSCCVINQSTVQFSKIHLAAVNIYICDAQAVSGCASLVVAAYVLLAIYSTVASLVRPQLACVSSYMCTAVSQLRSDLLVPLHHHAHFIYPACLFFLYMIFR